MAGVALRNVPGEVLLCGEPVQKIRTLLTPAITEKILLESLAAVDLTHFQKCIIAGVETGRDVFISGHENDESKRAYLIPVLSYVLNQQQIIKPQAAAPLVLFFCATTKKAMRMKCELEAILDFAASKINQKLSKVVVSAPKVLLMDNFLDKQVTRCFAREPIEILLLTASLLEDDFYFSKLRFLYNGVRYVVFEDLPELPFLDTSDVTRFLQYVNLAQSDNNKKHFHKACQVVCCGKEWNADVAKMESLLQENMRGTLKIFGSTLQALQHASITWRAVHAFNQEAKMQELIYVCKQMQLERRKVVIFCSSVPMAERVSRLLSSRGEISNILVTNNNVRGVVHGFFRKRNMVQVVSDDALQFLNTTDVTCICHFDCDEAANSISTDPFFLQRFACVWSRLGDPRLLQRYNSDMLSYLFLTGGEENILVLQEVALSLNLTFPNSLNDIVKLRRDEAIRTQPLCKRICCFGFCYELKCPYRYRHQIIDEDTDVPEDAPKDGMLDFQVIQSKSPSLYVVRLVSNYKITEKGQQVVLHDYDKDFMQRIKLLYDHFSKPQNCVRPTAVSLNEIVCIPRETNDGTMYARGRVLKILNANVGTDKFQVTKNAPPSVEVFLMDSGERTTVPTAQLLELPLRFKMWLSLCTHLILTNLLSLEHCSDYCAAAYDFAKKLTEGHIWQGNLLICLRDVVWVNPMVQLESDPITGHSVPGRNALTELTFEERHARVCASHAHMLMLWENIRKVVPDFPEIFHELSSLPGRTEAETGEDQNQNGNYIKWASLPVTNVIGVASKLKVVQITIAISSRNPWEMFGVALQGRAGVEELELKITEEITQRYIPRHSKNPHLISTCLQPKTMAALKDAESGRWRRALLLEKFEQEDELCNTYNALLVDHGTIEYKKQEIEEVLPLLPEFVDQLPLQLVCCKLAHIQPVAGSDWDENSALLKSILSRDSAIYAIAFRDVTDSNHPCSQYEAMLLQEIDPGNGLAYYEDIGVQLVGMGAAQIISSCEGIISRIKEAFQNQFPQPGVVQQQQLTLIEEEEHAKSDSEGSEEAYGHEDNEEEYSSDELWKGFLDVDPDTDVGEATAPVGYTYGKHHRSVVKRGGSPRVEVDTTRSPTANTTSVVENPVNNKGVDFDSSDDEFFDALDCMQISVDSLM